MEKIPQHIGIIMDGNGRWAKAQGKLRHFGHKKGSETLKQVCIDAHNLGVKYLTVYAFSTENWKRPKDEVAYLMQLLRQYLKDSVKTALEKNMCVRVIGSKQGLDADIRRGIKELEQATEQLTGLQLQIALNYGGRNEIIRAVNQLLAQQDGVTGQQIDEAQFANYLDTRDLPEPELIIRTGGAQRLSNFLLWQSAYSEFYFSKTLWPSFNKQDLLEAIGYYNQVERRFGGILGED